MNDAWHEPVDRFQVAVDILVRPCREQDLPALEWFGLFAPHRALIREVFRQHQQGESIMLVAEANGEASGQAWNDLRRRADGVAELWAVRVLPCLQGRGIGARLVAMSESTVAQRGCHTIEVAVETGNPRARVFYERLGYRLAGTRVVTHRAGDPPAVTTQWTLAKHLEPIATCALAARPNDIVMGAAA